MPERIFNVLRSFRVRELRWELDTGNYRHNALLYPIFYLLNLQDASAGINFLGRNGIRIRVGNSLMRMLFAFFK
ncbi:hypothetical protein [Salinimicrobium flavum]|uniref:Uncharacterized protein n=1 Tax=Salinimicrobium flavum TaxID=1737065 RepID=A0ABW5IVB0_9FLAO